MAKGKATRRERKLQNRAERASGGDVASPPAAGWDARTAKTARKVEKKLGAQEKARRQQEMRAQLASTREEADHTRQALGEAEAALREREGPLREELRESEDEGGGFLRKLSQGIAKTRESFSAGLGKIVLGKAEIDTGVLEGLEELLITADMGMQTTQRLLDAVRGRMRRDEVSAPDKLIGLLKSEVQRIMSRRYPPLQLTGARPAVILFVGVNGSGKTTTIGKIASHHCGQGKRVLLAAGDTFRAAATEQLAGWSERAGCALHAGEAGADPSSVMFQAVRKGMEEGHDLVLCDTAGRLHTKTNLMEELKKIKRVMGKLLPEAPHETFLVLDGNTGQNAIMQTREFHEAIGVTGLIVTKLDGTARGGVVVGIVNEFDIPIRYIGIGEGVDDLKPFEPEQFAEGLLG
jgi:fused signal recognition particle receptor